jgi:hypothetical protein
MARSFSVAYIVAGCGRGTIRPIPAASNNRFVAQLGGLVVGRLLDH